MRYLVVTVLLLAAVSAAWGSTYEWVDSSGVTHFTDNPDSVPAKYRSRIRVLDSVKPEEQSTPPSQQTEPADEKTGPATPAAGGRKGTPPPKPLRGGRTEDGWRAAFSDLRLQIKNIEEALPDKRQRLIELHRQRILYTKARDRVAYNDLDEEIQRDETRLKDLRQQLDILTKEADMNDIPMEWRQ